MLPCFSNAFAFVKIFLFANISMISRRSLAAVSVCFQTRFVFEPKAMQSYDHFLNCANFQAFFLKTFFSGRLRRSVGQGRFPFCGCKGTAICRTGKIFHRKNSNKFSQIFTHHWRPTTYTKKKFSHAKTAPKKQCASRPATHTLYNIENEFLAIFSRCRYLAVL